MTPASTSLSAHDLAQRLAARLVGPDQPALRGVTTVDDARPDAVTWAQDARYFERAWASTAGAVIAPRDAQPPAGRTALLVDDVEAAVSAALAVFAPPVPRIAPGVHPTAIVASSAEVAGAGIGPRVVVGERTRIAAGAQIHAGCCIGDDVVIGPDCVLWPNVVIRERVRIGARVVIHPNATIGADGFGYLLRHGRFHRVPHIGGVDIGDDVEIGANTAIDRGKCGDTRIHRGTKVDNLVQVAHNVVIGEDCVIAAQCGISGSTSLGHHVILAGQVGLVDHIRLGNGVRAGAQSGLSKSFGDGETVFGSPAAPMQEQARLIAAWRRLPDLLAQVRELRKRIERLETPAHPAR